MYGPEAVYQVEVAFQSQPEAGYGPLTVALLTDDGGGERMLLHQAVEQVRLMTGRPGPVAAMAAALDAAL